jgi:hypothetical protein
MRLLNNGFECHSNADPLGDHCQSSVLREEKLKSALPLHGLTLYISSDRILMTVVK